MTKFKSHTYGRRRICNSLIFLEPLGSISLFDGITTESLSSRRIFCN
jgi:hypothetical protein